ncbi:alpha-galactosidase [Klebsiella quasivariicola]|uniref:alpha-galactosidase n=1 Tax=Klebsiella quasivariicola TaxID=2026240 RepID=UPI001CCD789E|nr:alpha-galactosidase [Klebsiella quasivariicola]MBZ9582952.1 alpha-galactosidase [Klebsiella quasivariicola]
MEPTHFLSGNTSTLCIDTASGGEILYWGRKVAPIRSVNIALARAIPYGRLDVDTPVSLMAENGRGLFSSPGIEGHRDGQHWSPVFNIDSVEEIQEGLRIHSEDRNAGLRVTSLLHFDHDSDVIKISHTLTNIGEGPYELSRLAITLPLPERASECLSFYGRWVYEFQQHRHTLVHGGYQQENRRGRTSHQHYPALIAGTAGFGENHGEVWGAHFAWSGNHRMRIDVKADGRRVLQAEALYVPGEIVLQSGETITTPWLYATWSDRGLNGMSQQFHAHLRRHLLSFSPAQPRQVHLNTWEGIYFDHQPQYIMAMATEAARMGVERFIIDDGWFTGRNDDKAALGDWVIDEQKYPHGLEPVIEHVLKQGMTFGLWVEPEMISKNSDLYRQHPDWLLQLSDYQQPTGRNQYVLDLSNDAVFNYLFERLDTLLNRYDISYLKWDMNREVVQPGHQSRPAQTRQVERLYALMAKLRAKHPAVDIESCAAGGGRIDYEILRHVQRFWPSDNNDALERQTIQRGFSYFFPPEVMGAHIGAKKSHSTRRVSDIHFRGITALFGHLGIELDPLKASDEDKAGFSRYIELYKQHRSLIHTGTLYRLDTDDPQAQMLTSIVSTDRRQALVTIAQIAMPTWAMSGTLRLRGLDPQFNYVVRVIDAAENFRSGIVSTQPAWIEEGVTLPGEWLQHAGLAMPVLDPESAVMLLLEARD